MSLRTFQLGLEWSPGLSHRAINGDLKSETSAARGEAGGTQLEERRLVPDRRDETDPLDIIWQRRAIRSAMLLTMAAALLSSAGRLDFSRVVPALLRAPAPAAAPSTDRAPDRTPGRKFSAPELERQLQGAIVSNAGPSNRESFYFETAPTAG